MPVRPLMPLRKLFVHLSGGRVSRMQVALYQAVCGVARAVRRLCCTIGGCVSNRKACTALQTISGLRVMCRHRFDTSWRSDCCCFACRSRFLVLRYGVISHETFTDAADVFAGVALLGR